MDTVILDGFSTLNSLGSTVKRWFEQQSSKCSYFELRKMNIQRCKACGACSLKTPGKCNLKDDFAQIMHPIAKCDMLILLSPLTFGGLSSLLKKTVDRFIVLGLPLYMVKNGKLLHQTRYEGKFLLDIGLAQEELSGQEENFKSILSANGMNLHYAHNALVFKPSDNVAVIERELHRVLGAVNNR